MANEYYDINFEGIINYLLPVRLRSTFTRNWLYCMVKQVKALYQTFTVNRNSNLYVLAHNSQVVYLQSLLNDMFDNIGRGIYIIDGSNADPLFLYLDAETHPLYLGLISEYGATPYPDPQWLYTISEVSTAGYQFIVMVPTAVSYDPLRMSAAIDQYRLPSKSNYTILTY